MQQIGIVCDVLEKYALVEVSRKSACEGCHANADGNCSACISFGDKKTFAKADNEIGAKTGDRVIIETASRTVLLYAAAIFLFPLILGVVGFFIGGIAPHLWAPYVGALVGFALAFLIVWATLNRTASNRLDVKIIRIL